MRCSLSPERFCQQDAGLADAQVAALHVGRPLSGIRPDNLQTFLANYWPVD
jgi:hypothetical protein